MINVFIYYSHNDLAAIYRLYGRNQVNSVDLRKRRRSSWNRTMDQTDIPRLREGKIGGQVCVASVVKTHIASLYAHMCSTLTVCPIVKREFVIANCAC